MNWTERDIHEPARRYPDGREFGEGRSIAYKEVCYAR